jgi:hypothetical protein
MAGVKAGETFAFNPALGQLRGVFSVPVRFIAL